MTTLEQAALEMLQCVDRMLADGEWYAAQEKADSLRAVLTWGEQAEPVDLTSEWQACTKLPVTVHVRPQKPGEKHISTREGITPIEPDDLIMRGVQGEEYPIGREIFSRTYRLGEAEQAEPAGGEVERLLTVCEIQNATIKAMTAALAQQQAEPVAYCYVRKNSSADALTFDPDPVDAVSDTVFPLYAALKQAEPVVEPKEAK